MLIDWAIYGLVTWGLVALLNASLFKEQPAGRATAWVFTVIMFFINLAAMTALQYLRYQTISENLGFKVRPHSPLDTVGAFTFAWLFFTLLRKQPKVKNASTSAVLSSPRSAAVSAVPSNLATTGANSPMQSTPLSPAQATRTEEELWATAASEVEGSGRRVGLWAKAFAEAGGNDAIAKASYLKWRVAQLQHEESVLRQQAEEAQIALEEQQRKAAFAERAKLGGECPSCGRVISLSEVKCPHCRASFGPGSPYKLLPLRET